MLAVITVNTPFDEDDGIAVGQISLRDAISDADAGDRIEFDSSLNGSTIVLDHAFGQIDFDKSLTIDASMLSLGLTIDADDPTGGFHNNGDGIRIFNITDPSSGASPPVVEMIGLTLTGADPDISQVAPEGGAIRSEAILVLREMTFVQNGADFGAGVYLAVAENGAASRTVLTVENSVFEDNSAYRDGGGVWVRFGSAVGASDSVQIANSVFSGNVAGPRDAAGRGGALYVGAESGAGSGTMHAVTITSSVFSENKAYGGGAIHHGALSSRVDLSIGQTLVSGNSAIGDDGGGISSRASHRSRISIEDSIISGNDSVRSGGGLAARLYISASLEIEGSEFSENSAELDGGGIYARANAHSSNPFPTPRSITISRSVVSGNSAWSRGGGMLTYNFEGTETLVEDSHITGNRVVPFEGIGAGNGGGIYAYVWDSSAGTRKPRFIITGSTLDNNEADQKGGGIFVCAKFNGEFLALNSTLSGNRTLDTTDGRGGGIIIARFNGDNETIDAYLRNVTVTQNVSASGGGIEMENLADIRVRIANSIISQNLNHQSFSNNLVGRVDIANTQNNLVGSGSTVLNLNGQAATLDGTNIISDTPGLSALSPSGGFAPTHVPLQGSPVIDAGSNTLAAHPLTGVPFVNDQRGEGFTRFYDILGSGAIIDIGAHEVGLAKVVDVVLDNTDDWLRDPYSYAAAVLRGEQLRPFATQDVNTLQIVFSEQVFFANGPMGLPDGHELTLRGNTTRQNGLPVTIEFDEADFSFVYDPNSLTGTWTFNSPLPHDKYAIHLASSVTNMAGQLLDGEWDNEDSDTPDYWLDDPHRTFLSGYGTAGSMGGEFRFHFAYLPGDSDGDGIVEANPSGADDDLQPGILGDIDGDGVPGTSADASAAQLLNGNKLPLLTVGGGDLNDDEVVNGADLAIWETGFGGNVEGDFDGDGDSDGPDFLLWQQVSGHYSAWYIGWELGNVSALVGVGAPQVTNVVISGSLSTHNPFSFDTVDGSGLQLQTVPVGLADTISIVFSENVNVADTSLFVVGLSTGNLPELAEFSYDPLTFTAVWRFEGWALGDNYLLSLTDAITDIDSNPLDGEWTNPATKFTTNSAVSTFPSGDGTAGGSFNFVMTLLAGDANLDGIVNSSDYMIWTGNTYGGQGTKLFTQGDFDGNGTVDVNDIYLLYETFGANLQEVVVLADLNGDGDVDDGDLMVLNNNYGLTGATYAQGDLNGDGEVTDDDLDLAFAQHGLRIDLVS